MIAKILKANDQVVPCSTLYALTLMEMESPEHIELRQKLDENIVLKLGPEYFAEFYSDGGADARMGLV